MQYIQSITSTHSVKISSLTEVTLTHSVNISSLRRSADFRRRSNAVPSTCHIGDPDDSVKNNGSLDISSSKPTIRKDSEALGRPTSVATLVSTYLL